MFCCQCVSNTQPWWRVEGKTHESSPHTHTEGEKTNTIKNTHCPSEGGLVRNNALEKRDGTQSVPVSLSVIICQSAVTNCLARGMRRDSGRQRRGERSPPPSPQIPPPSPQIPPPPGQSITTALQANYCEHEQIHPNDASDKRP